MGKTLTSKLFRFELAGRAHDHQRAFAACKAYCAKWRLKGQPSRAAGSARLWLAADGPQVGRVLGPPGQDRDLWGPGSNDRSARRVDSRCQWRLLEDCGRRCQRLARTTSWGRGFRLASSHGSLRSRPGFVGAAPGDLQRLTAAMARRSLTTRRWKGASMRELRLRNHRMEPVGNFP